MKMPRKSDKTLAAAKVMALAETILPVEEERAAALRQLAETIQLAHALKPKAWELSLLENHGLRLNIGRIEVVHLSEGWVRLAIPEVSESPSNWFLLLKKSQVTVETGPPFAAVPGLTMISIRSEDVLAALPLIKTFHGLAVIAAASKFNSTPFRKFHSTSAMDYLRASLRLELPEPGYVEEVMSPIAASTKKSAPKAKRAGKRTEKGL